MVLLWPCHRDIVGSLYVYPSFLLPDAVRARLATGSASRMGTQKRTKHIEAIVLTTRSLSAVVYGKWRKNPDHSTRGRDTAGASRRYPPPISAHQSPDASYEESAGGRESDDDLSSVVE